jgi:phytoene dehydrogenase-like protein
MAEAGTWDVAVVGGGHNGLVAAYYLAAAGLRTVVLERRDLVGGACVTEEFAPGYRASTGAYVLSMLREPVWRDLRLAERGVRVSPAGPSLNLFDDGSHLCLSDDIEASARELARFSPRDAAALERFESDLARIARLVTPMIDRTPPDPRLRRAADFAGLLGLGARAAGNRGTVTEAAWLFATSAAQLLDERFESEQAKAAVGWHAINDSLAGPATPGTAFVLLHDHAAEEAGGGIRSWGFVDGGIGRVTGAMAEAALEAGASIRTGAEVERIETAQGRVSGVRLAGGETVRARAVLSNADPKRTFLGLVGTDELPAEFVAAIRAYRCEGSSMKINLAVSELPHAAALGARGGEAPYHRGIMEISGWLADLDRDQALARSGIPAERPHIELCVPTVHDPSLAPPGHHVVTIDVNSQPYSLAAGDWDGIAAEVADRAIARIGEFFPNLPGSIVHRQVLSPLDLERVLGITGGHALHGDMALDQLFLLRPVRGWADYRSPIEGLYLCGAGTHPGGGVTGANGRNCAREVLRDLRGLAARVRARVAATGFKSSA